MRQSLFVVVLALVGLSPVQAGPINSIWTPASAGWTVGPVLTETGDSMEIVEYGLPGLDAAPDGEPGCGGLCTLQNEPLPDEGFCEMCNVPEPPAQWLVVAGLAVVLAGRLRRRRDSSARQT